MENTERDREEIIDRFARGAEFSDESERTDLVLARLERIERKLDELLERTKEDNG